MQPFSWNKTSTESILLVDKSPENLCILQSTLRQEGYKVTVTSSGSKALIKIVQSPPDLVLVDTLIPKMDGYEITRQIKQNRDLPFIPVALLTYGDEYSLIKGLKAGVDEFLIKPVEQNELLARVRSLLWLKHSINQRDEIVHQRREEFLTNLTHDLRTPLTASIQMLKMLQKGNYGYTLPEIGEYLEQINQSNTMLLEIVDTMLDVYQYEAGCKDLNYFVVDLWELIQLVVQELMPLAVVKNLTLKTVLNNTKPSAVKVRGDRLELHRLLTNLVGNAIRFTDTGSVEIHLQSNQKWVTMKVKDTGIGMSKAEQSSLFKRFQQGQHQRRGNGLGLYLSRQIVEAHQGNIFISSMLGKGSVFTVRLPAITFL